MEYLGDRCAFEPRGAKRLVSPASFTRELACLCGVPSWIGTPMEHSRIQMLGNGGGDLQGHHSVCVYGDDFCSGVPVYVWMG